MKQEKKLEKLEDQVQKLSWKLSDAEDFILGVKVMGIVVLIVGVIGSFVWLGYMLGYEEATIDILGNMTLN